MCDVNEVSSNLVRWAVQEMGFRDTGRDLGEQNKLDLSGICLGPLSDVWVYIFKHIKDDANVQIIQGNLRLHSREQNEDPHKQALIRQRDMLREEIIELKKSTNVLHNSLMESKLIVQQKEKELRNQQLIFRDLKRSSYILNLVRNNMERKVQSLNKTSAELGKHFQSFAPSLEKETELERYKIDVENMSKLMQNSLSELLNEEPNIEKISATKMAVGNSLASLLESLPRPLFMKLIQEQQQTEIAFNSRKDSSLSPNHNKNSAFEFIPENSDAQPLQKLLHELSWVKADTRSRADKAKREISTLTSQLDELKSQVLQRLNLLSDGDENKLAIGPKLIQLEIQVTSRKSAIDALRTNLEELDSFCSRYEARQQEIEQKIVTIERNSRLSDHLTALTCTLARKRANNPRIVQQLANHSQKIVNDEFKAICKDLSEKIQISKSNIEKELEICRQLKPSQLFNVQLENKLVPVNRLAINRLVVTSEFSVSAAHLETTLKYLGLPRTLSVFRVLEAVGDKRLQVRKTQQTLKWHEIRKSEIAEKHGLSWLTNGNVCYKELAKKLEDSWNSQEIAILPSLDMRRKRVDESAKCIEDVEITLQEWCDEPAKIINTGRTVNGQSLEQWSAVWKKSLNMCRKKVN